LLDDAGAELVVLPSYRGTPPPTADARVPLSQGIIGRVARTGQPVRVDDVRESADYLMADPGIRSELAVPLKVADRLIGVLDAESRRLAAFGEADERLLTVVAGLLAPAIENARLRARAEQQALDNTRLYQAARRRADQMRLVNEVARDVAAILDVDTLLAQVARRLETSFGYYHAEIGLMEAGAVVFSAYTDERHGLAVPAQRMPLAGRGVITWAARNSLPRYVPDVSADPEYIPSALFTRTCSEAVVPLVAQGQTIGVLDIQHDTRVDFGPEDAAVLEAIAGQVAVAVTNARLFTEVRQRAAEVTGLLTTTLAVSSSLELAERLQSIAYHARALVEGDVCTIYRRSADGRELLPLVALDEHFAEEILAERIEVGDGVIGYVARSGVGELVNQAHLDPRAKQIAGTPLTPESLVAVPLVVGASLIGVMAVYREGMREFTAHHFDLLSSFAAQAAVAIENAELYQTLRTRADSLEVTYNELAQLDRLKDEMVQNISHELRTPLTFLKSYVDLLLAGDLGALQPEQRRSLEVIQAKTEALVRLVNDTMTLQTVGPATLRRVPADLRVLAQSAVEGAALVAREAGIGVDLQLPDQPMPVQVDLLRLAQVFDNLLGNAIKFTERGGRIEVRVFAPDAGARVEVRDTGIGMAPDDLEHIFDRFFQVDGTLARRRGGIGLGLAIAKLIVEAHGGQIGVTSRLGEGSCFFFELPLAD
jgi:signal transduction histidine kinase